MGLVFIGFLIDAARAQLMLHPLSSGALSRFLLVVRYSQGSVFGIDDEDSQQARRFCVTRILTDSVMRARQLVEAFAGLVDFSGLVANLAANGARQHVSVDECRWGMVMCRPLAAWRIAHDEGSHALSLDVRDDVLEDEFHLL